MKVLLLAGEQSGLIYLEAIKNALPDDCEVRGFSDYGFDVADLGVMGILPVIRKARYLMRVKRTMEAALREWYPDVLCTIDYPGMNLRLAAYAKKLGIRTIHVVSPQVWAWKKGRIPRIEAALDKLLCFFPFEPALYKSGFATFVGHPLASQMREAKAQYGCMREKRLVAILPGSRISEIERNLPVMLKACSLLDNISIEIPAASEKAKKAIERIVAASKYAHPLKILDAGARALLLRADVAAVASGTATLEAALASCPTVLVYRVSWLFALAARIVIKGVMHIGLANIIWEKSSPSASQDPAGAPMPELLQEAFTPEALAEKLKLWLDDEGERSEAVRRLEETCALLDAGEKAIEKIAKEVSGWIPR